MVTMTIDAAFGGGHIQAGQRLKRIALIILIQSHTIGRITCALRQFITHSHRTVKQRRKRTGKNQSSRGARRHSVQPLNHGPRYSHSTIATSGW